MNRAGQKTNHERKRPTEQQAVRTVKLGIRSQAGDEVFYRFSYHKKLQKLFMNYCEDKNFDYTTIAFVYDGRRINPTKTPAELFLQDGDMIDAMVHQIGGGVFRIKN